MSRRSPPAKMSQAVTPGSSAAQKPDETAYRGTGLSFLRFLETSVPWRYSNGPASPRLGNRADLPAALLLQEVVVTGDQAQRDAENDTHEHQAYCPWPTWDSAGIKDIGGHRRGDDRRRVRCQFRQFGPGILHQRGRFAAFQWRTGAMQRPASMSTTTARIQSANKHVRGCVPR